MLTLAIEIPVALAVFRGTGRSWLRIAGAAVLASGVTHPALWFVAAPCLGAWGALIGAEAAVVLVEAVVLRTVVGASWRRVLAASLLMNTASFLAGLVLEAARWT